MAKMGNKGKWWKVCPKCDRVLSAEHYYKRPSGGAAWICRECHKKYYREKLDKYIEQFDMSNIIFEDKKLDEFIESKDRK